MRTATRRATVYARRDTSGNGLLNNLVAYWPLNEAGGANDALDLHSNALTLTQVSSPGSDTGKVYAGARTFDGIADYFSRASEAALQPTSAMHIAVWIWIASKAGSVYAIVDKFGTTGRYQYTIQYINTGDLMRLNTSADGTATDNVTVAAPAIETWALVEAIVGGGTIGIALNGGAMTTKTYNVYDAGVGDFCIGARSELHTLLFPGRIGPVAMWKSAAGGGGVLSEAQRAALYNAGAGLPYAGFTA